MYRIAPPPPRQRIIPSKTSVVLRLKHTAFMDPSHLTLPVRSTFSEDYFLPTSKMGVNTPVTLFSLMLWKLEQQGLGVRASFLEHLVCISSRKNQIISGRLGAWALSGQSMDYAGEYGMD